MNWKAFINSPRLNLSAIDIKTANAQFETEALPTVKTFPVNFDPNFYTVEIIRGQ